MNVGARSISTGNPYASKAALRRAVQQDPSDVLFYSTEVFSNADKQYRASEIPAGVRLDVCGPDPYTKRNYYGTATRTLRGIRLS